MGDDYVTYAGYRNIALALSAGGLSKGSRFCNRFNPVDVAGRGVQSRLVNICFKLLLLSLLRLGQAGR